MTTQVRKNVMDMFIDGARRGFTIATTNLLPNVVMAFVIIQALKITGLLDWVGHICEPVMALWGLPGEAATVLLAALMSMGGAVGVAASLATAGALTGHDVTVLLPAMKETLRITNLGDLKVGDWVNVERAAKFSDEIGGHLMSGHIMTTAEVAKILTSENNRQIWFKVQDSQLMKYILYKGFIGIDGISLTVGEVTPTRFCVHLIPETLERTTLGKKKLGARVNIEIDPQTQAVVDTVERVLAARENAMNQPGTEA